MVKKSNLENLINGTAGKELFTTLSFEEGMALLEELVGQVEMGALPLQQALSAYEKGVDLVEHLRTLLSGAEEKLKLLQREKVG